MSFDLDLLAPRAAPRLRVLPLVHERVELAAVARAVLDRLDPAVVAVELPTTLEHAALTAVARLPRVSLVVSHQPGQDALVWTVAPGDPLVEALRWAVERGRRVACVDPDIPYREVHRDPVPDPWALWSIGPESYLRQVAERAADGRATVADRRRERGMAWHLARLRRETRRGTILALVGAAHAGRLARDLASEQAQPLARVRRAEVELWHPRPEDLTALLPDAPLAHAVWESVRAGELPREVEAASTFARPVSVVRYGLRVLSGERGMGDLARRRRVVALASRLAARRGLAGIPAPDRLALGRVVWRVASGSYHQQTGEETEIWQRRIFEEFGRRQARVQGQLVPGLYEWVVAARGVADDNLAWEVFDAARSYPWQEEVAEIPVVAVDGDELHLGTRSLRFRRRFLRVKSRPVALPVRRRPQPDDPADWLRAFEDPGICSYPREDLVIEDWGRFLQQRAVSVLSVRNTRSEPFTAGVLDGIDLRETLRNLQDGRIWVRETGRVPGRAGSVVVIFDADPEDRYPYTMTWIGEHDQESDMAFYATDPAQQVVGPGILRATYGGFLMTMPPGRLLDVWSDPDYRFARSKPELLLMAGIDYSRERFVVHVGPGTPADPLHRYAAARGKQIVHLPLASLSPPTLRKIRVVHLLAGKDKRRIARDYIW